MNEGGSKLGVNLRRGEVVIKGVRVVRLRKSGKGLAK